MGALKQLLHTWIGKMARIHPLTDVLMDFFVSTIKNIAIAQETLREQTETCHVDLTMYKVSMATVT